MLKSIFFLLLAVVVILFVSPFVFVAQTARTAWIGFKAGGFKKAWKDVADYFYMVAVDGLDQLGGTILYKVQDLTISSYTFVLCKRGKACWFKRFINKLFGKYHCQESAISEVDEMEKQVKKLKEVME